MSNAVLKGNASGTGTVTLETPNTNTDRTISIPDATGSMMVSGAMPAFSAVMNTSQTLATNTWTKVVLNYKLFDTNNNFDATTNYRFTPTVAGYYSFTGCVNGNNSTNYISFYKNGNQIFQAANSAGSNNASIIYYMNGSTDYVELYLYCSSGQTISNTQPNVYTSLSGCLVRAA